FSPPHPHRAPAPLARHVSHAPGAGAPVRQVQRAEGGDLRAVPEPRERGTRAQAHSAGPRGLRRVLQNHHRPGPYPPRNHSVVPARLAPQVELEIERRMRAARLPLVLVPQFVLAYDIITAREGTEGRPYEFHELAAWRRPWGVIPATRFARAIEQRYGVSRAS